MPHVSRGDDTFMHKERKSCKIKKFMFVVLYILSGGGRQSNAAFMNVLHDCEVGPFCPLLVSHIANKIAFTSIFFHLRMEIHIYSTKLLTSL